MSSSQDMTLNLQHTSLFEEEEETSFLDMSSSFDESRRLHEEEGLMIYHINEALGYEDRSADLLPSNWDWEGLKESLLPYLNQEEESSVDFDMDNDEELLSEEELFEILLLTPPPTPAFANSSSSMMQQLHIHLQSQEKEGGREENNGNEDR